jgi:hypothetical protein
MKTQEKANIFNYRGKKAMFLPEKFCVFNENIIVEFDNNIISLKSSPIEDKLSAFLNSYDVFDDEMLLIDDYSPEEVLT